MSELSCDTKALLSRAKPIEPLDPGHRRRLKAAVFAKVTAATLGVSAVAAVTTGASATPGVVGAVVVGAGLGITVLVGHHLVTARQADPSRSALSVYVPATAPPTAPRPPSPAARAAMVESPDVAAPSASQEAPALQLQRSKSGASPALLDEPRSPSRLPTSAAAPLPAESTAGAPLAPKPPMSDLALEEEARLLREADALIKSGDTDGALRRLNEHQTRFPGGVLSPERGLQRVLALCVAGRLDAARREAAPVLERGGPLAARVRESCAFRR